MGDVRRLIEATDNDNYKALIALCGYAGLRITEALELKASDVDIHRETITLRGKGDRTRVIPVAKVLMEIIMPRIVYSFINNDAPMIGLQDRFARRLITGLGRQVGISKAISSHDLRSTFGTTIYQNTLDLRLTQELMGHSQVQQTVAYTGVLASQMRAAVTDL